MPGDLGHVTGDVCSRRHLMAEDENEGEDFSKKVEQK